MKTLYNTPIIEHFYKSLSALATGFFLSSFIKPYAPIRFEVPRIILLIVILLFAIGFSYITSKNKIKHTVKKVQPKTFFLLTIGSFGLFLILAILYFIVPSFNNEDLYRMGLILIPSGLYSWFLYGLFNYLKNNDEESRQLDKYGNVIVYLTYSLVVYFGAFANLT